MFGISEWEKSRKESKMKKIITAGLVFSMIVVSIGCQSEAQKGAGLGALVGAGAGALIGHQKGKTAEGALIGGAVGGGAGYMIGNEADKKKTKAETNQAIQSARQEANTMVVNIKNSNDSVTPVTIRRVGNKWVGPRGEEYSAPPTEKQLRPVYGF